MFGFHHPSSHFRNCALSSCMVHLPRASYSRIFILLLCGNFTLNASTSILHFLFLTLTFLFPPASRSTRWSPLKARVLSHRQVQVSCLLPLQQGTFIHLPARYRLFLNVPLRMGILMTNFLITPGPPLATTLQEWASSPF